MASPSTTTIAVLNDGLDDPLLFQNQHTMPSIVGAESNTPYPAQPGPPTTPVSDSSLPTTTTNASWPKRVRKACCGCRRDKIRCDGARPCSGCLKKGFDILCIDGCAACRRSRELCDGRNPCRNCDERHLVCEDEVSSPVARHEVVPPTMPPPVRTGERAKLACLACRRDNKKCGDQRPCARCISRSEECIHVNRGPKIVKSRCQACRDQNRKCEDVRPCRHCAELGERCYDTPRKGQGHGTRVKAACMACRRNKTQCGNERPCKNCEKRGLECIDKGCTCAEQTPRTKCHVCRSAKSQDGGLFSSPPLLDNTRSFLHSDSPTTFDAPFGFPQPNPMQNDLQGLSYTAVDIDPLLIGSSQSQFQ